VATTTRVERTIDAPIDQVFDLVTDHANYSQFAGIQASELVREGTSERNGVGALRRITSRPIKFEEEVTAFERPTRMEYRIVKVNAPIKHRGGSMVLEEVDGGTHIVWTSTSKIPVPGLGALAGPVIARGFNAVLDSLEQIVRERSREAELSPAQP
jgi:uncharacterized protein YndB with AHSA1/START domain